MLNGTVSFGQQNFNDEQLHPNTPIGDLISTVGLIAVVFHHLAPLPVIVGLFRKQTLVEKTQGLPLIAATIISALFVMKGFQENSPTIYIGNSIGLVLNGIYYLIYLYF